MAQNISVSKTAATQAMVDTLHGFLGVAVDTASETTKQLSALSVEMAPRVAQLTVEAMGSGASAEAAQRALRQIKAIVESEIERNGWTALAAGSAKISQGLQTAAKWFGVLVKAAVLP